MSEALLSVEGLTLPEDDVTVSPVQSFGWGVSGGGVPTLRTLTLIRAVDELSAGIVALHQSREPRAATLTWTDDAGVVRLELKLTGARVTSYVVNGGMDSTPLESFTLEANTVEMTTGSAVTIVN